MYGSIGDKYKVDKGCEIHEKEKSDSIWLQGKAETCSDEPYPEETG